MDLPEGRYVFGIDSNAWRSAGFEHKNESTLTLGSVLLTAPEGLNARFTLHEVRGGALVTAINSGAAMAVPQGSYELRRDLAETAWPVEVKAQEQSHLDLGAISLSQPLQGALSLYVAAQDSDAITGVLYADQPSLALPAGAYRLLSLDLRRVTPVNVVAGKLTTVPARITRYWSARNSGGVVLQDGPVRAVIKAGSSGAMVLLGNSPVVVDRPKAETSAELPNAPRIWLWQYEDGSLAHETGVPLLWAGAGQPVALPGGELKLKSNFGFAAKALITLRQGDKAMPLVDFELSAGWSEFTIPVPLDVDPGQPLEIELKVGPAQSALRGVLSDIPVHRLLGQSPTGLEVSSSTETEIRLAWDRATEAGVAGFRIYRGQSDYPVSGRTPVTGTAFSDIALSAGQTVSYRVCPVDNLGIDGPCSEIGASTQVSR